MPTGVSINRQQSRVFMEDEWGAPGQRPASSQQGRRAQAWTSPGFTSCFSVSLQVAPAPLDFCCWASQVGPGLCGYSDLCHKMNLLHEKSVGLGLEGTVRVPAWWREHSAPTADPPHFLCPSLLQDPSARIPLLVE